MVSLSEEEHLRITRRYIKLKIMEDNITFRNHPEERAQVYDIMKRTVSKGESHSALLIGPKGSGKSTLVNSVLYELGKEFSLSSNATIVKLSGLIHTDEKIALKSITAQMQLENAVGNKVFGTFAESLAFLFECLRTGYDRTCKSMLFVVDYLDLFCKSGNTQTLLYNLFDITHACLSPMCVIGITNRLDVMELLEKRVKSRFSHRHILIFPTVENQPPVEYFKQVMLELLSLPVEKKIKKESEVKTPGVTPEGSHVIIEYEIPDKILSDCYIDTPLYDKLDPFFVEQWNVLLADVLNNTQVIDAIEKFCYYTVNEQIFRNALIICKLTVSKPYIDVGDVCAIIDKTVSPEHSVQALHSLSILELSLVVAMKHAMDIFDNKPMNFEMVLHRYTKFANANSSAQTVPRPVILKAFEHLQALEIIVPVKTADSIYSSTETTASRVQKEYKLYTLAVPVEDITEAIKTFKSLPTEISHWYNNSVV